jgi:hypothetical protein
VLRAYDPGCDCVDLPLNGPHLTPPLLAAEFGQTLWDGVLESVLERNGYYFKMFLPDAQAANDLHGVAENGPPGIGGSWGGWFPGSDTGEAFWCCYAWPVQDLITGHHVFFINQEGRVLRSRNNGRGPIYDGLIAPPAFDAAYSDTPESPDFLTGMGARPGNPPREANDGNRWTRIR